MARWCGQFSASICFNDLVDIAWKKQLTELLTGLHIGHELSDDQSNSACSQRLEDPTQRLLCGIVDVINRRAIDAQTAPWRIR